MKKCGRLFCIPIRLHRKLSDMPKKTALIPNVIGMLAGIVLIIVDPTTSWVIFGSIIFCINAFAFMVNLKTWTNRSTDVATQELNRLCNQLREEIERRDEIRASSSSTSQVQAFGRSSRATRSPTPSPCNEAPLETEKPQDPEPKAEEKFVDPNEDLEL